MFKGKDRKETTARIVVALVFAVSFIALVIRSRYSFCWIDESFYISLADRLYRGTAPFIDEWHPSQAYAALLLPFYALFVNITGSTDGIVFYFRILTICISFIVSVFTYLVLRRNFGDFISCCIALVFLFYARANILGASYYTFCMIFFMLGLLLGWCTYQNILGELNLGGLSARNVLLPFMAGMAFALATICNPYAIAFMFFACLTGLIRAVMLRRSRSFIPFAWGMTGAVLVACIYFLYLFSLSSPVDIIANIPNILGSHDENLRLSQRLPNYLSFLPVSRIGFVGTWLMVIFLVFWRFTGRGVSQRFRTIIMLIDVVCLMLACYASFNSTYPNKVFLAFAEFALPCFLLQEDVRLNLEIHPELHLFWIPGIILSLIWQFSSNTQVSGMIIGFMFACCGAFITVRNAVPKQNEMLPNSISRPSPPWLRVLCMVLIAGVVLFTAYIRLANVYSDCSWEDMNTTIESGPGKGLVTSHQHAVDYKGAEDLVAHADTDAGIWIVPMSPWCYLEAKGPCAAVSTWNTFMDENDARIYYDEMGHERPTWIMVTNDDLGSPVNVIAGRVKYFPALDMYHDATAQLRSHLEESPDYVCVYQNASGKLYKRTEHSEIRQG